LNDLYSFHSHHRIIPFLVPLSVSLLQRAPGSDYSPRSRRKAFIQSPSSSVVQVSTNELLKPALKQTKVKVDKMDSGKESGSRLAERSEKKSKRVSPTASSAKLQFSAFRDASTSNSIVQVFLADMGLRSGTEIYPSVCCLCLIAWRVLCFNFLRTPGCFECLSSGHMRY